MLLTIAPLIISSLISLFFYLRISSVAFIISTTSNALVSSGATKPKLQSSHLITYSLLGNLAAPVIILLL
jgi:hypothetical protein